MSKTKKPTGRKFVFTVNNYEEDDVETLKGLDYIKYCVVGFEEGEEKETPHLQGYLQVKKATRHMTESAMAKRLNKVLDRKGTYVRLQSKMASDQDAIEYCKKGGEYAEWGEPPQQGKRTDIAEYLEAAKSMDVLELADKYPKQFAKYHKAGRLVREAAKQKQELDELKAYMESAELRQWQIEAIEMLEKQDDRKVDWYVDIDGGQGKTFLAKWLIAMKGAFYLQGGKTADVAHAYSGEDVVVCDFTRDKEDCVQYSAIESLKNGIIFSPKYDSTTKIKAQGAKIIVFSNWAPDKSKLSADRWNIINLHGEWGGIMKSAATELQDAPDTFRISDEFIFE